VPHNSSAANTFVVAIFPITRDVGDDGDVGDLPTG
jgi:hypothetical protein